MSIFKDVETFLYQLSALFFYPVIAGLLILLAGIFYRLGLFCREGWRRLRNNNPLSDAFATLIATLPSMPRAQLEIELAAILEQAEQQHQRSIQSARYSIKMGPTLGLIGTLTPMAKALSSLSSGNLAGLSTQMVTAFSTTVLGLIVGGIAYSIVHVRTRWQARDLFVLRKLAEEALLKAG